MSAGFEHVPDDLKELNQWVMWRYLRDTKVPFQVNGRCAKSTDPSTWTSYETAEAAYRRHPDYWPGIGFVFSESDPFAGIDLDDCISDGEMKPWAYPILERFADTYMEVSPSGAGIKIWCKARLERSMKAAIADGGIEVYDRARYFTVTGRAFRGERLGIEEHQADVDALRAFSGNQGRTSYRIGPKIEHGDRHFTLVSIGGTLARRGVMSNELAALFLEMRKRFTGPAVPDSNLICLADDLVRRYGNGN